MRRKLGFTLVELLVVIAIIILLVSILAPSLNRARELTKRVMCRQNLNSLGKGYAMYQSSNDDKFPYLSTGNNDWWSSATGTVSRLAARRNLPSRFPPNGTLTFCITSLEFMLVREGQNVGLFVCPSDNDSAGPETSVRDSNGVYYWDFSRPSDPQTQHTSYSIQSVQDGEFSIARQFILADKNPNWDLSRVGKYVLTAWRDPMPDNEAKNDMSRNHQQEVINTLRGDGSAAEYKRADIGDLTPTGVTPRIQNDCIYTSYGGTPANARASITTGTPWNGQAYVEDAFLWGPIK